MHKFSITLLAIAVLSYASAADGAITLALTKNPQPAPGLDSFTVRAVGTAGEVINSFAGINIGGVHNVQPPFGQPATISDQWATNSANGASLAQWKKYDTYFLFGLHEFICYQCSLEETNDGSDPAGLKLTNVGLNATEGLGSFRYALPFYQIAVLHSLSGSDVAFMQVVQPAGSITFLDVVLIDITGARANFVDFAIGVPEPSSILLVGLGCCLLSFQRVKN